MAYTRPTLKELQDRSIADIESSVLKKSTTLKYSVLRVVGRVIAGMMHLGYGYIDWVVKQLFVETADETFLKIHAKRYGLKQKEASFASGNITVTGTSGAVIPALDTIFVSTNDIEYQPVSDAIIVLGSAIITVNCLTYGADGNLASGEILTLKNSISGINSEAVVAIDGITNGVDKEDVEDLRQRVLDRIQNPPHGGNSNDYVQWTKEIAGVTRAWCLPLYLGAGTVGVTFVCDDLVDIIPNTAKIQEVNDYIETQRPATAQLTVFAPTKRTINLTLKVSPISDDIKANIISELKLFLTENGYPGNTLYLSQFTQTISNADDILSCIIISPNANIVLLNNEIAVLGVITWQTV
jgi:uncharacterized phage protein gp47/JayE